VVAAQGYKKVRSADIAKISDDKEQLGTIENIKCDCICVSGFWTPTIHLASQSGNKTKFNEDIDAFVPGSSKQNEKTLGAANGTYTLDETLKVPLKLVMNFQKKLQIMIIKFLFQTFLKKNQQLMISFGVYRYLKEKIIKDF
jgi:sarcosine oxidase subunit alpha